MRVLIAVPTFETITPDTYKSLWDLDKPCDCDFHFVRGYDCAQARTNMASRAIEDGYDYILMVDSDIVVPENALRDLLEHESDVCIGFYVRKGSEDGSTCLYKRDRLNYDECFTVSEMRAMRDGGEYTLRVKGGGLGCALVSVSVFEKIAFPWFDWVTYADGHGVLSEDLYFCRECERAHVPIYADTRVACGHVFRTLHEST